MSAGHPLASPTAPRQRPFPQPPFLLPGRTAPAAYGPPTARQPVLAEAGMTSAAAKTSPASRPGPATRARLGKVYFCKKDFSNRKPLRREARPCPFRRPGNPAGSSLGRPARARPRPGNLSSRKRGSLFAQLTPGSIGRRDPRPSRPVSPNSTVLQTGMCFHVSGDFPQASSCTLHMQKGGRVEGHLYYPRIPLETLAMYVTRA